MVHVGQTVVYGVGGNFVHLIVACVLAYGFVAGHVASWGISRIKGRGNR